MLDITVTAETKKLIDKLVRTENKDDIADIVKKLVSDATDFTAMRYANYTEYGEEDDIDKIMDIEKKSDRVKYLDENNIGSFREEFINVIPYMPLTDEEQLYRKKTLRNDAPERKNKYLDGVTFYNQERQSTSLIGKYILRAMSYNPDFDFDSAEKFVSREIKENIYEAKKRQIEKQKNKSHEKIYEPVEHEDFLNFYVAFTQYMKRKNFFMKKLYPHMTEEEIIDSGYEHLLINLHSLTNPNYMVMSFISVDFTFARAVEDFHNEEMKEKFGDDFKAEFFGETFVKTLQEVV